MISKQAGSRRHGVQRGGGVGSPASIVVPERVAEVEFRVWAADGHLRYAAFRGLRAAKLAREVAMVKTEADHAAA
mgnify:CR=1 FL=1